MKSPNFYEILGVARSATSDEIRAAYHKLAQEYHPDKHAREVDASFFATEFRHIHEIYEILINTEQRKQYDEHLRTSEGSNNYTPNGSAKQAQSTHKPSAGDRAKEAPPKPDTKKTVVPAWGSVKNKSNTKRVLVAMLLIGAFVVIAVLTQSSYHRMDGSKTDSTTVTTSKPYVGKPENSNTDHPLPPPARSSITKDSVNEPEKTQDNTGEIKF